MRNPRKQGKAAANGSSPLDRARISKTVRTFLDKRRPPAPVRAKLDYGFHFHNQSVELFEVRPKFRGTGTAEHPFAKATFVKSLGIWKIYWMRSNLKWYRYEPDQVSSLDGFLKIVDDDENGCFFG